MALIDIYRAFHPKEAEYTFFSSAHGLFSKIDNMVECKTSLNKFKKIKIISSLFLDHNGLKLENNLNEKTQCSNTWRPNNMSLNNEWVNSKIKEEIKKYLEKNENEHTTTQNLCDTAKVVPREVHSNTGLSKDRKISNKPSNPTSKRTRKTTTNKVQS